MMIVTVYALIGDDVRILTVSAEYDYIFWIMNIVSFFCFLAELILASIVNKNDYFLGFFFWLDFISTASILMDIGYVTNFVKEHIL